VIEINVFGNIKCCYFYDKWKMQHFYIKNFFFPMPMGGDLTLQALLGYATGVSIMSKLKLIN